MLTYTGILWHNNVFNKTILHDILYWKSFGLNRGTFFNNQWRCDYDYNVWHKYGKRNKIEGIHITYTAQNQKEQRISQRGNKTFLFGLRKLGCV